jgi:hypothetical protein
LLLLIYLLGPRADSLVFGSTMYYQNPSHCSVRSNYALFSEPVKRPAYFPPGQRLHFTSALGYFFLSFLSAPSWCLTCAAWLNLHRWFSSRVLDAISDQKHHSRSIGIQRWSNYKPS